MFLLLPEPRTDLQPLLQTCVLVTNFQNLRSEAPSSHLPLQKIRHQLIPSFYENHKQSLLLHPIQINPHPLQPALLYPGEIPSSAS